MGIHQVASIQSVSVPTAPGSHTLPFTLLIQCLPLCDTLSPAAYASCAPIGCDHSGHSSAGSPAFAHSAGVAGGVQSEFFSSKPQDLLRVLKEKGLDARIEEGTGIIRVKGVFNLTDVVMEASKQGVNIARVSTRETDLETYFINLVGGHGNV